MNAIVSPEMRQSIIDEDQLRLLTLAHYIDGVLTILFASIFIFHFVFFVFMASDPNFFPPPKAGQHPPPDGVVRVMGFILGGFILAGWSFGALIIYVGHCIKRRTKRGLAFVVAGLNLLFVPVGSLLGVSTIIVLSRASVKRLYESK